MTDNHTCSEFTALISQIRREREENLLLVKRRGDFIVREVKFIDAEGNEIDILPNT